MTENTPTPVTTAFVRRHYAQGPTAYFEDGRIAKMPDAGDVEYAGRQFDAWLAQHDADLLAERNALAAVIKQVREQVAVGEDETLGKWAYRSRLMVIHRNILPTAPATVLAQVKADAWDEGWESAGAALAMFREHEEERARAAFEAAAPERAAADARREARRIEREAQR